MLNNKKLLSAIIAIALGFVVAIIFAMILGINTKGGGIHTYMPQEILVPMFKSFTGIDLSGREMFNPRYIGEFIVAAIPLILTGLSVGFAWKTGLFNIGSEGQLMMGSVAATLCGLYLNLPVGIHAFVCIVAAGIAGFITGFIPGYLKAKFDVHEVVTCIMLNYVCLYLANMIFTIQPGYASQKTPPIKETASLSSDFLASISGGSRLNWSILIVIVALIAYWFIINKTTFGYQLKAIGHNKHAAEYAGMKVKRGVAMSMGISGVFAGLAGAALVLGIFQTGRVLQAFEEYGYNGIAVALVGANSAFGILLAGGLFSILQVSQPLLQAVGIPREIAVIISALIIFFYAIPMLYEKYIDRFQKKRKDKKFLKENKNNVGGDE
ncbi:MAG: ABC transporter permease [Bacilli bacterium]|jgi:simple sugar transport system permease protein|nr:ABC transporter permease [Bacilli bacterium]